jgi:hypothetical protein
MQRIRPAIAADPRAFGRGLGRESAVAPAAGRSQLAADLRLFATAFLAGFIFVSVFLA